MRARTPQLAPLGRRGFLVGTAAAGAGLLIGFHVPLGGAGRLGATEAAAAGVNPINAYLRIAPDDTVTVLAAHMDMGQGIYNGIATLVAEELDADWSQMQVEGAAGNPRLYGNLAWGGAAQGTGGSTGTPSSWERYRRAGAVARALLVAAAAQQWGVPAAGITVVRGVVGHAASGRRSGFGALAEAAAAQPLPVEVRLKEPRDWSYIGNAGLRRLDSAPKSTGRQMYTIDVRLPDMLTAVVVHPPRFGARVRSFDAGAIQAVAGVEAVVETPRGVAVVARDFWTALKGRAALRVTWDESAAETRGSAALMAAYRELAQSGPAAVARREGDGAAALDRAGRVIETSFEFPYLAHAAMEPMNAVARYRDGRLEVWGGHQIPDLYQHVAAGIMGIPVSRVTLHVMMTGGGFGRRATPDADVIVEAVSIVKALGDGRPVKVQWTREDDTAAGRFRPMYHHTLRAALDAQGMPVAWHHRIVGQSILKGTVFEAALVRDGIDETSVEGASTLPYAIPNLQVDLVTTEVGVPVLWWRSVGSTHTAYATEVFLDQLAHAAGRDPVDLRRALLRDQPRHLGVLNLAAEKAGWGTPLPEGRHRGIAVHKSFGTYVAQVAEVALDGDGRIKVERVVCAVDCGVAVNPDVVRAQVEGGIGFGLGAILKGEITLEDGRVAQTNFDGYEVLRIDEMPRVEVHIVPSREDPTGIGEPGVPPIGPAVANALQAATGRVVRSLPIRKSDLRQT